jgi:hypothetical protein
VGKVDADVDERVGQGGESASGAACVIVRAHEL